MPEGDGGTFGFTLRFSLILASIINKVVWPSAMRWREMLSAAYSTFEGRIADSTPFDQHIYESAMHNRDDAEKLVSSIASTHTSLNFAARMTRNCTPA